MFLLVSTAMSMRELLANVNVRVGGALLRVLTLSNTCTWFVKPKLTVA